jgi:hypothetical protein
MYISKQSVVLPAMALLLVLAIYAGAQNVPTSINYQGRLTTSTGDPVPDGSYGVIFTIYDSAVGGDSKWTETRSVNTDSGYFAVILGSINPIKDTVFNSPTRYLGIKVESDPEMTPRNMLVSVPHAMRVSTIHGATGGVITGKLNVGLDNDNSGDSSFVAGIADTVNGGFSTIGGGNLNSVDGWWSVIGGGKLNNITSNYSTIGGGQENTVTGPDGTIGGGIQNVADYRSTVGGGRLNRATGVGAAIGGGTYDTANGSQSMVPGGYANKAAGDKSFAAGFRAKALHNGTFVWADETDADFESSGPNQFLIRANGGVGINTGDLLLHDASVFVEDTGGNTFSELCTDVYAIRGQNSISGASGYLATGGGVGVSGFSGTGIAAYFENSGSGASNPAIYAENTNAAGIVYWGENNSSDASMVLTNNDSTGPILKCFGPGGVRPLQVNADGKVGINQLAPSEALHVVGNICYTGSIGACSDERYKKDITTISGSLDRVLKMRGITYRWKKDEYPEQDFDDKVHLGFIAQEVEELCPEVVISDDNGYKSVDYSRLTPVLLEAIKEQQEQIDDLKEMVDRLVSEKSPTQFGQK